MSLAGPRCCRQVLALLVLLASSGSAQAADEGPGIWLIYSGAGPIANEGRESRWRWWFDGQLRYFDRDIDVEQYLLRPAIGYRVTDDASAWLGIALIVTLDDRGNRREERRVWQQLSWSRDLAGGKRLESRTRLAQRRRDSGDGTAVWLRQQVALTVPMPGRDRTRLVLALEPFIDFRDTDWGATSGLSQIRARIGARFKVGNALGLEAGYMNQYFSRDDRKDLSNHLAYLHFRGRF